MARSSSDEASRWGIEEAEEYWDHPVIDLDHDMWWIFLPQEGAPPVRLRDLLPAFASRGFVLMDHSTHLDADDGADAYLYDRDSDLHVCLTSTEFGHFYVGVKADPFLDRDAEDAERHASLFLDVGRLCAERVQRPYAYTGSPADSGPDLADLAAGKLTHVFWAQWFGPDVLDALGRDVIAQAPAWRAEEAGGGLLYFPAASPVRATDLNGRWPSARRYFTERFAPSPVFVTWG